MLNEARVIGLKSWLPSSVNLSGFCFPWIPSFLLRTLQAPSTGALVYPAAYRLLLQFCHCLFGEFAVGPIGTETRIALIRDAPAAPAAGCCLLAALGAHQRC